MERRINLLLIGGTGVGKSTWLNAFANYCAFESLREAEEAGGVFPIFCTCHVRDPLTGHMIQISPEIGSRSSIFKAADVGESDTQSPCEYVFKYENAEINVIDTPGLLDTKDVGTTDNETDKKHVKNILRLLSAYDEIHAICIVLKATENRISENIQYIFTEILGRLDKSASNNVIFIFTNASSTNFKPEKSLPVLQALLTKIFSEKDLEIPLPPQKETAYCFDNGAVQYLVERKNEITPGPDDAEDAARNWRRSRDSAKKMIQYVCSLDPLSLTVINAMYDSECTIGMLSKLVLETLQCIVEDVTKLERKKSELEKMKGTMSSNTRTFEPSRAEEMLLVSQSRIVRREIGHVNVVCEAAKCAEFVNEEPVYTKICCEACDGRVKFFCQSMNWRGVCKNCGCGRNKHRWRTTESKVVTDIVNVSLRPQKGRQLEKMVDNEGEFKHLTRIISMYEDGVKMYEDETEQMLKICAKLNSYVKKNALIILSGVDEFSSTLTGRIEAYGSKKSKRLENLKRIREKYNKYLAEEDGSSYKPDDVSELIQQLYELPKKGNDLKEAMEIEERARRKVAVEKKQENALPVVAGFFGQLKL